MRRMNWFVKQRHFPDEPMNKINSIQIIIDKRNYIAEEYL